MFQRPNPPALFTALGFILSLVTSGVVLIGSMLLFLTFGIYWSYLEITTGVNNFRKALGWIGLMGIGIYLFYRIT